MLSLFYTGKGFFLFFRFSAVGHGFLLLIIEEGRGWKRIKRGGKRRQEGAVGSAPWAQSTWDSDKGGRRKEGRRKEERMDEMLSMLLP